jgi:4-hydroxy-4-methyl-2-oxoglutarate aldolase
MFSLGESLGCGIVSDVLDMLGYPQCLLSYHFKPNFPMANCWGKVRTIQLAPLLKTDDPDEIHKGLALMDTLNPGDVVIVAGGTMEYAYWGELMSTTAKFKGAIGAVIDGLSRDFAPVIQMGFPVFSRGSYGRDIKNRGKVTGIDIPVTIDQIRITPGQWVFADIDGIAIIPVEIEKAFFKAIQHQLDLEKLVKSSILSGVQPTDLIKAHGVF